MPRHPSVVPHQHDDSDTKHAGIEKFLACALKRFRNGAGEHGNDGGAEHAGPDADHYPAAAVGNTARCRHDNADNETGFDDFTKDDD